MRSSSAERGLDRAQRLDDQHGDGLVVGDQRQRQAALAQHHRLVLPAAGRELLGPGHRPGLGAGAVAQRDHGAGGRAGEHPRRPQRHGVVGLLHHLLGDADRVEPAAEPAGERLEPTDQADRAAVGGVGVGGGLRAAQRRAEEAEAHAGGQPEQRLGGEVDVPALHHDEADQHHRRQLQHQHAHQPGPARVERGDEDRHHQVGRDRGVGREADGGRDRHDRCPRPGPPSSGTRVPGRRRAAPAARPGRRRRCRPGRRCPPSTVSGSSAARVKTRAASATRPMSVTRQSCPRSCSSC